MTITINTNLIALAGALLAELLAVLQWAAGMNVFPAKWLPYVLMAIGILPKVTAVLAHFSNPNGTSAQMPWLPKLDGFVSQAEAVYEAYRAQAGGKSLATGAPIPAWSGLRGDIQDAWKTAAAAAQKVAAAVLLAVLIGALGASARAQDDCTQLGETAAFKSCIAAKYGLIAEQLAPHAMALAHATSELKRSMAHPMMPDTKLTPGAMDPAVTQATIRQTICQHGYTATVRNVSRAEKDEVLRRYGMSWPDVQTVDADSVEAHAKGALLVKPLAEFDHYISLEIGGTNDVTNLWPQYYAAAPGQKGYLGARQKDVVETWLHRQVCSGAMPLVDAQQEMRQWPQIYETLKRAH